MKKTYLIILLFLCQLYGDNLKSNQFIYLEEDSYKYIDYLINSNQSIPKFILQQPFKYGEIENFNLDSKAGKYFHDYWQSYYSKKNTSIFTGLDNNLKVTGESKYFYSIKAGAHYISDDFILGNRTEINKIYKYDPFYPGDLSVSEDWLYGRVNDAYMDITINKFNFFIGRMDKNWGMINTPGLILSNNPYTYDHINFNYKNDYFRFSLFFARLEDDDTGRIFHGRDSTYIDYENIKSYISGHRLDINFNNKFQIALTEMAIYGGENRPFELSYANPMTFYYGVQRNQRKEMSGLWSLDLFYKIHKNISLYSQFLIDDIIINNNPGIDDRGRYPDRFAMILSFRTGDLLLSGLNTDLSYVRVWNDTYQSRKTWESYQYEGLGLGYPEVACEEVIFKTEYWKLFPFFISNEFKIGRYGDANITDIFLLKIRKFPVKPVTNNFLNTFKIKYYQSKKINYQIEIHYIKDPNHYDNRLNIQDNFILTLGVNLLLSNGLFY